MFHSKNLTHLIAGLWSESLAQMLWNVCW